MRLPAVGEVGTERFVLHRVPSEADAEPEPAEREQVDLGGLLRDERGLALREDDDAGHQLERRDRGEVAEQHERLVKRRVDVVRAVPRRVHLGIGAEHVVVREQVREAELLDPLRVRADRAAVRADLGLGEHDAYLHGVYRTTSHALTRRRRRHRTAKFSLRKDDLCLFHKGFSGFQCLTPSVCSSYEVRTPRTSKSTTFATSRSCLGSLLARLDPDAVPACHATRCGISACRSRGSGHAGATLLAATGRGLRRWKRHRARSAAEHIANLAGHSVSEARQMLQTSKRVKKLPKTAQAMRTRSSRRGRREAIADAASRGAGG